jgi:hypothetical protein
MYRLAYRLRSAQSCVTPGPAQVVLSLSFNDDLATVTPTITTLTLGATSTPAQQGEYVFWASSPNVQYQTVYTACTSGTGVYNLQTELEKLQ